MLHAAIQGAVQGDLEVVLVPTYALLTDLVAQTTKSIARKFLRTGNLSRDRICFTSGGEIRFLLGDNEDRLRGLCCTVYCLDQFEGEWAVSTQYLRLRPRRMNIFQKVLADEIL